MQTQRAYVDLNTIYPPTQIEGKTYTISQVSLTREQVMLECMRNAYTPFMVRGLKPDFNYIRLVKKGEGIMMSDTPMERNTNSDFIRKANGDVIIFGLGLGLVIIPLLSDPSIKSVTIVELYQDLIDLVLPILKPYDKDNKLSVVQGDAFTYQPLKTAKFDTIYFDIWISIDGDNYEEQKKLEGRFRKHLNKENPNSFMDSWMKSYYKRENAKETREKNKWKGIF